MEYKYSQVFPESRPSMSSIICNPQFYASSISCGSTNHEHFAEEYDKNCIESTPDVCSSMDFSDLSFSAMLPRAVIDTSASDMFHPKQHIQNVYCSMDCPSYFSSLRSTGAINPLMNQLLLAENIPMMLPKAEVSKPSGQSEFELINSNKYFPNSCLTSFGELLLPSDQKTLVSSSFVEIDNCVVPCRSEGIIEPSTMPNCETTRPVCQASNSLVALSDEYTQVDSARSLSELRGFDSILQWISSIPDGCISIRSPKPSGILSPVTDGAILSDPKKVDHSDGIPIDFDKSNESFHLKCANVELSDVYGMPCRPKMVCSSSEDVNISEMSGCYTGNGISSIPRRASETDAGQRSGPKKGLFSELGLDPLLHPISKSVSDEYSSGTKRTDSSLQKSIQSPSAGISCIRDILISKRSASNLEKSVGFPLSCGEVSPKPQAGLWIDGSYNISAQRSVILQSRSGEVHTKVTKKRSRSGECARQRPKDRQMIQDRIKELREIIPNGGKFSIDALLHSTIKHVLFLQEVVNHADKLKEPNEAKLIGQENGVIHRENTGNDISSTGGATWGLEVGDQTSVCPIIVEDLKSPGHMLIEILCEEGVYFFEIAALIRSFGLTILKGMMEIRQGVIWTRFMVKVSGGVTRLDVFMFLIDFLQKKASSTNDLTTGPDSIVGIGSSLPSSY